MKTRNVVLTALIVLVLMVGMFSPTVVVKADTYDINYMRLPGIGEARVSEACYNTQTNSKHRNGAAWAVDFSGVDGFPIGTPVYAPANGQVIFAGYDTSGYGHLVKLLDDHGLTHYLAHLSKIHAYVGQNITKGDLVGLSGNTGGVAVHLHWHVQDSSSNPVSLISLLNQYKSGNDMDCNAAPGSPIGYVSGPALSSNSATSCSEYANQGFSEVALFDNTDCRGNVLRFSGAPSYAVKYNLNSNTEFNDRARSIYIPSGWVVRLGGNTDDNPNLVKYFSSSQANLDNQTYDNTTTKVGYDWGHDPNAWNMTSYAVIAQSSGYAILASSIGGFVIGTASIGGGIVNGYITGNENGFNTVAIFDDSNCAGTQYGWHDPTNGWFDLNSSNGPDYMNDISSCIRTDTGWSALVSSGFGGSGGQKCFTGSGTDLVHATYYNGTNMNNSISSVRVYNDSTCGGTAPEGVSAGDTITVHVDPNYSNTQYGWHDPTTGNTTDYMSNNITSIGVVPGWSIAVYENQNLGGGMFCFSRSEPDLTSSLFNNDAPVNDNIESVGIYNDTTCGGLGAPPNVNMTYQITNPGNRTIETTFSWSNAAPKWHVLYWGDGTEYSVYGVSGSTTVTHQYDSGDYTMTFNVIGNDRQTYTVTEPISMPAFECGGMPIQQGVVIFEYENCSYVYEDDYSELTELGLYNLSDLGLDDEATSIHFPQDGSLSAKLYEGANGTGQSVCRSTDMWYMSLDQWPDQTSMDNTVSSVEVFDTVGCTPYPEMSVNHSFLDPHGQIQLDVSWSGAAVDSWQIINWGDGTDYGIQGASGSASPTHWYASPGTYNVTFQVTNAAPDYGTYTLSDEVVVSSWECGSAVAQSGVSLYNFSTCAYRDSADYEEYNSDGIYNLVGLNNLATSIHVPSGKSVKLFEGADQTGDNMCVSWDMWSMDLDTWPLGGTVNDSISSIQVFSNTTCTP